MNTKIYVGNLPFDATEQEVQEHFSAHGAVTEVNLVMDRETGQPRGFAFVVMENVEGMESAIRELDGKDFNGRSLKVNEARPRENRSFGSGGGGGGNYGNRDRNGGGGNRRDNNRGGGRW